MKIWKRLFLLCLFLCLAFPGSRICAFEKAETVRVQLKWHHGFQFAGYYAAIEKGFFAENGLHVVLEAYSSREGYVQAVLNGQAEYGVADAGLLTDRMLNRPVVLLRQIFQHSPMVFLSLKGSGIKSPYDMIGKKVVTDKASAGAPLAGLLLGTIGGLDQTISVPHAFRMEELISGNVDVIPASITDEPFFFKKQKIDVNIINPQDYGIDFYGDNLFTTLEEVQKHPERVEKMIRAVLKGWGYALQNQDELIDIILEKYNPELSREKLSYEAKMTELMILPELTPLGSVTPHRYQEVLETLVACGFLEPGGDLGDFIYQSPGRGARQPVSKTPSFSLASKEMDWLAEHPDIRVGIMDAWPPLNFVDEDQKPQGIGADYIRLLNKRLNGVLTIVPGPFKENYELVKRKELGALMDITPKKDREHFFNFTRPYLSIPHVIVGRRGGAYFSSEEDLAGKTVALERGFYNIKYFRKNHPKVILAEYASTSEALDAVSRGEADAYAGNRAVAMYLMEKELFSNLQVQGRMRKSPVILSIGVRKDWPELTAVLDRALASITEEEIRQMHRRWAGFDGRDAGAAGVSLTPGQRAWLDARQQIRVGIMDAWPPMDFVDDLGKPKGIGTDFIEALNKRLDGKLTIVPGAWEKIYNQVKNSQLDAVMGITPRKDREPHFNFTRPYANIPHVIVAPLDGPYYSSVEDLFGKILALEEGFYIIGYLKENHPDIRIRPYASTSDALDAVSKGEADAYAGNRAVASYLMETEILSNLQIQGKLKATASINSIGVRKDWPNLAAILDSALASLSQEEVHAIYRKWGGVDEGETLGFSWISLAPEEKAWLNDHPVIRVASDVNWAPVEFLNDDGGFSGITADYLDRMSKMLGVEFQYSGNVSWKETLDRFRNRELDMISAAIETQERKSFATFTKPYLSLPTAVFTLDDSPYIGSLEELYGRKVAAVKGYAVTEFLKREYPAIEILEVENIPGALSLLQAKKAFAYIGTFLITGHYIRQTGYTNLKATAETGFNYQIAMAARSDWPLLVQLLQKAMDAIDEGERNAIFRKWTAVSFKKHVDHSLIYKIVLIALAMLGVFLLWNRRLSREVAERKRVEKAIMESEERLKLALRGGDLGFWDVNLQTGETVVNRRWAEMLGYSPGELELTRETWANTIHPEDRERILKVGRDYRAGRIPDYEAEYRSVTKQDDVVWLATKGAIVSRDEGGAPVRMVGTVMDITERKKMETELFKAKDAAEEADRLKSAFLAAMSHELRTPLNSIIGFTGIILQGLVGPLNEEQKKQLGMVKDSSQHLLNLINDVLDISKIEAGQLEVASEFFDMREVIEKLMKTLTPMAEKKGLALTAEVAPGVRGIESDRRRVEQVLINLINNAIKFSENGTVHVECRLENGGVVTRVVDTGIGIKPEDVSKLFKPFQQLETGVTRRYEGTGLGLSICRKLIELLGGEIHVDSQWGVGSTFAFTLPLEKERPE